MGIYKTKIGSGDPIGRFDMKNTGFNRGRWDPLMREDGDRYYGRHTFKTEPGYTLKDWAFQTASWNLVPISSIGILNSRRFPSKYSASCFSACSMTALLAGTKARW